MASDRSSRLVLVFIVFFVLLNYPLLGIFDRPAETPASSVLYFYLFLIWLLLIVVVGLIVRNKKQ